MLLLLFYPVIMLGMIFDPKVLGVMPIANHRLILFTFERSIFSLVAIVVLIRRRFIDDDFIRMVWIISIIRGRQRCAMDPS